MQAKYMIYILGNVDDGEAAGTVQHIATIFPEYKQAIS